MNMNVPLVFVALAVLLTLSVVAVLARSLWRAAAQLTEAKPVDDQAQSSAAIYKEALKELDAEREAGQITESEWAHSRDEIAKRLTQDLSVESRSMAMDRHLFKRLQWGTAVGLLLLLPLAFGLYQKLGETDAMDPDVMALSQADHLSPEALERALTKRLASRPADVEAWVVLARVQRAQGQFEAASYSFDRAFRLTQDPVLNLERLEATAMQRGGRLNGGSGGSGDPVVGDADAIIQAALAADPNNSRVLLLSGQVAFANGDFTQALVHWRQLLAQLPPESAGAKAVEQALSAAQQQGGRLAKTTPGAQASNASQSPQAAHANAVTLKGRVALAPHLLKQVAPQDTLFITAVEVGGPPMPLAVIRRPASDLLQAKNQTLDFLLDDESAMSPQASLSALSRRSAGAQVWVRARISKSGNPIAQSGDLKAQSAPLKLGTTGVVLTLSEVVP
jgi:cytochrome c-type biogenesis protein CcmH